MYKLLGNQFIYRIPFEYHKSEEELNQQIHDLIYNEDFPNAFKKWLDKNELDSVKWLPADLELVEKIRNMII